VITEFISLSDLEVHVVFNGNSHSPEVEYATGLQSAACISTSECTASPKQPLEPDHCRPFSVQSSCCRVRQLTSNLPTWITGSCHSPMTSQPISLCQQRSMLKSGRTTLTLLHVAHHENFGSDKLSRNNEQRSPFSTC